jgi:hypothetical protein
MGRELTSDHTITPRKREPQLRAHAHEYAVVWNPSTARFDVQRDNVPTLSFSFHKADAISIAIRKAERETLGSCQKIIVTSIKDGKRIVEWDRLS